MIGAGSKFLGSFGKSWYKQPEQVEEKKDGDI
jgi:hypothetical protein